MPAKGVERLMRENKYGQVTNTSDANLGVLAFFVGEALSGLNTARQK